MLKKETRSKPKILIVDDQPGNIRILSGLLKDNYSPIAATSGLKAIEIAGSVNRPDIILLDIMMPGMDGYTVCRQLKADEETRDIPVIFITAKDDVEDEAAGFHAGAVDYISKPFTPAIVEARIKTHLELKHHRDHLEAIVAGRTRDLTQSHARLSSALVDLKSEINRRKNTEQHLRASESKLSSIINTFQGFIYTVNIDKPYRIDFMNRLLEKTVGQNKIGARCYKTIFGLDSPCPWCEVEKTAQGDIVETEIEHPRTGRWYYAVHSPVFSKEGSIVQRQTILIDITRRKAEEKRLREREAHLHQENRRLKKFMKDRYKFGKIIGKSRPMQKVYEMILKAADDDAGVIVYGESGTGKELVARAIHGQSRRQRGKLVSVNCGAISEKLAESEFFGHVKGAFTGADQKKAGFFDAADGGTLFLDEIGEIRPELQVKLLRAIEGGGYSPVGSQQILSSDFRIIAATSADLKTLVKQKRMREDFFYRIHVIPIYLPPLRERKEDIPLLIEHFLRLYGSDDPVSVAGLIQDALKTYDWPGNIRELENTVRRYLTLDEIDVIGSAHARENPLVPAHDCIVPGMMEKNENTTLRDVLQTVEKKVIFDALERHGRHKANTARSLGLDPKSLYRKIKQYDLEK